VLEESIINPQPQEDTQLIKFDYVNSHLFRVVAVDGVIISATPQGKIFLHLYNERVAIPRQVTHETLPDGTLGKEVDRIEPEEYVREVEVGIVIDIDTAKLISDILSKGVKSLEGSED
jgi:hypothetical protein